MASRHILARLSETATTMTRPANGNTANCRMSSWRSGQTFDANSNATRTVAKTAWNTGPGFFPSLTSRIVVPRTWPFTETWSPSLAPSTKAFTVNASPEFSNVGWISIWLSPMVRPGFAEFSVRSMTSAVRMRILFLGDTKGGFDKVTTSGWSKASRVISSLPELAMRTVTKYGLSTVDPSKVILMRFASCLFTETSGVADFVAQERLRFFLFARMAQNAATAPAAVATAATICQVAKVISIATIAY